MNASHISNMEKGQYRFPPMSFLSMLLITAWLLQGITLKEVDHIAYSFNPHLLVPDDEVNQPLTYIPFYPHCSA